MARLPMMPRLPTRFALQALFVLLVLFTISSFPRLNRNSITTVSDSKTNITLLVTGTCREPFTYVGVDSRTKLLHYYDLQGTITSKVTKPQRNWARVVLLKQAFDLCPQVPYFVYSDTDGYIVSRKNLHHRLKRLPAVVYQHGMWSLNSGFSSWRNDKAAFDVLMGWYSGFTKSNDFYAEQRALLYSVGNHSASTVGKRNGFIGWHIKGRTPHKTAIANMGRMLCYYEEYIIGAVLLIFVVIAMALVFLTIRLRFTDSVRGVKPLVQAAVLLGKLLRNNALMLICSAIPLLFILLIKTDVLGEFLLHPAEEFSRPNLSHLLPGGTVMVNEKWMCFGRWCTEPRKGTLGNLVHNLLERIAKTRSLLLLTFFLYGITNIIVPYLVVAWLFSIFVLTTVSFVFSATNLGNILILHDVADGNFGLKRRVLGKWTLRAIAPRANSGNLEVVKEHNGTV